MSWWILKKDKKTGKKSWMSVDINIMMFMIVFGLLLAFVMPRIFKLTKTIEKYKKDNFDKHAQSIIELNKILKSQGVNLSISPTTLNVSDEINKIAIDVDKQYRINVLSFLASDEASSLLTKPTSKPGILKWHIYDTKFISNDLMFASYEDGHEFGGHFLAKIKYSPENSGVKMKVLWDY